MPHDGYRLFDNSELKKSFENLSVYSWKEGLKILCNEINLKNE